MLSSLEIRFPVTVLGSCKSRTQDSGHLKCFNSSVLREHTKVHRAKVCSFAPWYIPYRHFGVGKQYFRALWITKGFRRDCERVAAGLGSARAHGAVTHITAWRTHLSLPSACRH